MSINFSIIFFPIVLISLLMGYLVSSTNIFKTKRFIRIFIYILAVFVLSIICVISYGNPSLFPYEYEGTMDVYGYMSWIHSFWFYIGTRIRTNFRKINKLYTLKKIIGWLSLINGFALLFIQELGLVASDSMVDILIAASYLIFGILLLKKHPISEDDLNLKKTVLLKINRFTILADKTTFNTFFFGYFSQKWKVFIRTILISLYVLYFIIAIIEEEGNSFVSLTIIYLFLVPLISRIVKHFIVKDLE